MINLLSAIQRLRQREKMATLGAQAADLAHELNNPIAAAKHGAAQLPTALDEFARDAIALGALNLDARQRDAIHALQSEMIQRAHAPVAFNALTRSDREKEMRDWLEHHGAGDAAEIARKLTACGWETRELEELERAFSDAPLAVVLRWLASGASAHAFLHEVETSVERAAEIVKAVRAFAPGEPALMQVVDVQEGLETTLIILRHKLQNGIRVTKNFAPNLPRVQAYAGELNQVWMNLVDNAADAMGEKGELALTTRLEHGAIVVEICDNGPGIPRDIQSRIFEPLFTTKARGTGAGLGLSIARRIVEEHRGKIEVESVPGRTCFRVKLPAWLK